MVTFPERKKMVKGNLLTIAPEPIPISPLGPRDLQLSNAAKSGKAPALLAMANRPNPVNGHEPCNGGVIGRTVRQAVVI